MTDLGAKVVITPVSDSMEDRSPLSLSAALCVDHDALDRFGVVVRHLLVGLVDQAVHLRVISADARIEQLKLGPIQSLVHKQLVWPLSTRRTGQLIAEVAHHPPTVVHALSGGSYRLAASMAEALDADLVLQVTSLADCDAVADVGGQHVGRFLPISQPLHLVLEEQLGIPTTRLTLVRPGVQTAKRIACFADPQRIPTILCTSPLERDSGIEQLITAIDTLRRREHHLMLFLLGAGSAESAARRAIREYGLSSCITLANATGDRAHAMRSADIFVASSKDAIFSADSLQAMAAGMAVVTFPNSITDHFLHDETALVCDKPSAESLAAAIEGLLANRPGAKKMATAGMQHVRTHHGVSNMAERTAHAYRRLALARTTFSIKE